MKYFVYLRMSAVITLLVSAVCILLTTYQWRTYDKINRLEVFWVSEALLVILMSHSILSIALYNYYPNKSIPKSYLIIYRIAEVGCWLCVVLLLGSAVIIFFSETDGKSSIKDSYLTVILCLLFIVLLLVQII